MILCVFVCVRNSKSVPVAVLNCIMMMMVVQLQMVEQLVQFDKILAVDWQHRVNVVIEHETNHVDCRHDTKFDDYIEEIEVKSLFVRMEVGIEVVERN